MSEFFTVRPSRRQRRLLFAAYALAALAAVLALRPGAFAAALALLLLLLGRRECTRLAPRRPLRLELRAGRVGIGLARGRQSHFFAKYKVYACRWFAILRLIDDDHRRTLILIPDCFASDHDYRRLRFCLGHSRDAD